MKRILFYNGIGTSWADSSQSPSPGLMALSAFLKLHDYDTAVLGDRMSDETISTLLRDTLAVGFSVLTGIGINQSIGLAKRLRRLAPRIPHIWGGYHPTLEPEQTIQHDCVDYVIRGEGEHTLLELLHAISNPSSSTLSDIRGLSFKKGNETIHNADRPACDLSTLPTPDYSLYQDILKGDGDVPYVSSRGCPFDCRFCCNAAFNRQHGLRFRQLPVSRVMTDLSAILALLDANNVTFWDDLFLSTPARIAKFISGYREHNFSFRWRAFGRCDVLGRLTDETLSDLTDIGLKKLYFGVESGSERMLRYLNKRLSVDDVLATAHGLSKHGLSADFSFINGFPGETRSDVEASLSLRQAIKNILPSATIRFFVYTPLPGVDLIEDCRLAGYTPPDTLDGWSGFEFHAFDPPWLDRAHVRWIRNISYASMFDEFAPARCRSARDLAWWGLNRISRYRLGRNRLHRAPELELVARAHRLRLRPT